MSLYTFHSQTPSSSGGGLSTSQIVLSAAGAWTSITAGADAISQIESATNDVNSFVVDFLTALQRYAEWAVVLPVDYDGGPVTARFMWTAASASTNAVVWGIAARAFGDGDALDQAFGTAVEVTDANNATGVVNLSGATADVTIAGTPASGKYTQFRVYRLGSGADNLAATARLLSVAVTYSRV